MATTYTVQAGRSADGPAVRTIGNDDLKQALARGFDDFQAMPTHAIFVTLIYPVVGLVVAALSFGYDLLPLLFPLMSGFVLISPFAAIFLYALSRRREQGLDTAWSSAADGVDATSIRGILTLGLLLTTIFLCWIFVAYAIYGALFDGSSPASLGAFVTDVLTTARGWTLIVVGNLVGFAFALLVLALSAVSFPMLLDRPVSAGVAIETSLRVFRANPKAMLAWGAIIAGLMVVGSIPLFVGLAVVLPILGHATWHLYRRAVAA